MSWLISLVTRNLLTIAAACFAFGIAVGAAPAWKYQGARLDTAKAEYKSFVDQTRLTGEQAQKEAARKAAQDKLNKERYDAQHKKDIAANADLARRLLNARSGSGYLSAASTSTADTERTCFNRAQFDSAVRRFDARVSGIVEKGSDAVNGLDIARQWAQGRR